ncbi:PREDICTED: uncharacterized protein LOC109482989 [Branchiostoma belcheri]|uniref:Uncharacterized protein LOC109482989 n=1 Tax=Branchiostoma belcheri TaxID=7741 RepID=A0A6P5AE08_BRABE|nr:PREDICTED: uncharacterized protein LOC109482989 [Branchiostoma belcheri]KAI8499657.1 hypothetical protein Bbelb_227080 [Branchiostoma belcheri]
MDISTSARRYPETGTSYRQEELRSLENHRTPIYKEWIKIGSLGGAGNIQKVVPDPQVRRDRPTVKEGVYKGSRIYDRYEPTATRPQPWVGLGPEPGARYVKVDPDYISHRHRPLVNPDVSRGDITELPHANSLRSFAGGDDCSVQSPYGAMMLPPNPYYTRWPQGVYPDPRGPVFDPKPDWPAWIEPREPYPPFPEVNNRPWQYRNPEPPLAQPRTERKEAFHEMILDTARPNEPLNLPYPPERDLDKPQKEEPILIPA